MWNIWMKQNALIFNDKFSLHASIIFKIIHMFLSWIDATPGIKKKRLKDSAATAKCNLEFLGTHTDLGDLSDRET